MSEFQWGLAVGLFVLGPFGLWLGWNLSGRMSGVQAFVFVVLATAILVLASLAIGPLR